MSVGLVVVSHSAKIAEGVADLAGQMAEGVAIVAAGGTPDGGIGTDFDRIAAAIGTADGGDGVVILCDLGSAVLTAETAVEFADDPGSVRIADAPIVEGAVAAAVASRVGGDLDAVVAAAESARGATAVGASESELDSGPGAQPEASDAGGPVAERSVVLRNASGLHARPAAEFVTAASGFSSRVTVDGVDATSLLGIMSLGATRGREVRIRAEGPDAADAVDALVALVESGFGES